MKTSYLVHYQISYLRTFTNAIDEENTGLVGSTTWKDPCLNNCRARGRGQNVKTVQKHSCTQAKDSRNKIQKKIYSKFRLSFMLFLVEKTVATLPGGGEGKNKKHKNIQTKTKINLIFCGFPENI